MKLRDRYIVETRYPQDSPPADFFYVFCVICLVISNISINFVHNYDKPTEDAVYDKYKYHASGGGYL